MKINGNFPLQNLGTQLNTDILSRLNIGDMVRAQILEMTSNELILRLFDGTTFKAATLSNIDAKPGDFVDFNVKNKNDGQLFLETVKNNNAAKGTEENTELKKELIAQGIKPDAKNMEIAKEIKQNQLPLNKENFLKIADSLIRFKELSASNAAFLEANHLGIEEKNIESLKQLMDGKQKMGLKIEDILKSVNELEDPEVLDQIAKKLNHRKSQNTEGEKQNTALNEEKAGTGDETKPSDKLKQLIRNEMDALKNLDAKRILDGTNLEKKILDFLKENKEGLTPEKWDRFLNGEDIKGLKNFGKEMELLFKKIKASEKNENPLETSHLKENSKETIQKALNDLFVKINSPNLEKELQVKELYKDLYNKLEMIKESLTASGLPAKDDVMNKIDQLQNNIKFLNELNNHNTYIQIPLHAFDKNTTGELYILKREGKKKKIDPENSTLFISLDTHNIGRVDSLININKKNIGLNIRAEDQEILDFIKSNYGDLYKRLSDKGYKIVDIKYRMIEEPVNIKNINQVVKKEMEKNQMSIDLRL
ncbi:MAG: flagellar hook-length control protein FliK [Clostridia bacterium]|nr:flagellar hook-length control protein FliK [Clostridia bacterium]